ncbi:MAG: MATE family efflux transporter [Cellulosilyticum sp.]|nr:MATE family efflux transporter [Cellulosilyticum sp.]
MTKDLTAGNPAKLICMFSIPLLIGNLFQQFYSMVDTAIVGRFVGVNALAAVGATGSMSFLIVDFVIGLTAGFAIPIAQTFGANDKDKMRHYVAMSIYLSIALSIVVTILAVCFAKPLLELMNTPVDIIDDAYTYIVIIFAGLCTTVLYNMVAGVLRSIGDSKTPLYFLILSAILNVILDLVFILKFQMGVAGAAYATVISQGISGVLCLFYAIKRYKILHLTAEDFRYQSGSIYKLLRLGFPMALQYSITAIGIMVLQSAVNSLGSTVVAAYTAASKVEQLALQPFKTLGITMATYTGQNLGAGKMERIKKGVTSGMVICTICCIISGLMIFFLGDALVGLFITPSPEAMAVIETSREYLIAVVPFLIPVGAIFIYRNSLQGLGEGLITLIAGMIELVSRCIVALFFTSTLGYTAIYLATQAAWLSAGVFLVIVYYVKMKKGRFISC